MAIFIVTVYIIRLFTLQIMSDDYKKNADSNAFLKKVEFPARGVISDRNGKLLVYNQNAYDIMVVMNEEKGRLDTTEFSEFSWHNKRVFHQENGGDKRPQQESRLLTLHAAALHESAVRKRVQRIPGKDLPLSWNTLNSFSDS